MSMVKIPLKDGTEYELPEQFWRELCETYYGAETELYRMRLWCLANPDRRKTRRGARRFVFNWINKACQIKPKLTERALPLVEKPREPLESRKERLAELKKVLKGE
jgi:hypothetical protein